MAKFNIQAVPNFTPAAKKRVRDYGSRNIRIDRMQRALAQTPDSFTLGLRLILEMPPDGKMLNSSTKNSVFQYSVERMRWENLDAVTWNCSVECHAIALEAYHNVLEQAVVRQLMDLSLTPGMTISFEPHNIHLEDDVLGLLKIPHEDFVINEAMDPIDWQKELVASLGKSSKPRFTRRRKQV